MVFFSDGYSHLPIRGNASDGVSGLSFQVAGTNGSARNFSITANNSANGALDIRMSNANNNTPNTNRLLTLDINSKLSLSNNDAGTNNTIFGASAGASIQSGGQYNTLFGASAGTNITTADQNTLYGYQCGDALVGGSYNVAMGVNTLGAMTSGGENVAIGNAAMASNVSGLYNVVVGQEAMYAAAGSHADNGEDANVAIGYKAMQNVNAGSNQNALVRGNIAIGYLALQGGSFGSSDLNLDYNIAIGINALNSTGATEHYNTVAIGRDACTAVDNTDASNTVAVGAFALGTLTSGRYNTAIGYAAMYSQMDIGDANTAVGYEALYTLNPGSDGHGSNTAVGYKAGYSQTTAENNTYVGARAGEATTGAGNVMVGREAGVAATSTDNSTLVGHAAGAAAMTGNGNTCIGASAGTALLGGDENTLVGGGAGDSLTSGRNCTIIGFGADASAVGADEQIVLGKTIGHGDNKFTFGAGSGDNRVHNTFTTNATFTRVSDERYKKDIKDNTDAGLDFINDLRTVTFKKRALSEIDKNLPDYDESKTEPKHKEKLYGLIAQEVKEVLDKHNITDFGGWDIEERTGIQSIAQSMFVYPLIKAVQELSEKVESQQKQIEELKEK